MPLLHIEKQQLNPKLRAIAQYSKITLSTDSYHAVATYLHLSKSSRNINTRILKNSQMIKNTYD